MSLFGRRSGCAVRPWEVGCTHLAQQLSSFDTGCSPMMRFSPASHHGGRSCRTRRHGSHDKETWKLNELLASPSPVRNVCQFANTQTRTRTITAFSCVPAGTEHGSVYDNVHLSSPVLLLPEGGDNERL